MRQGGLEVGRAIATGRRRRAPRRGDQWPLDEVVIAIAGQKHGLWRAVDPEDFGRDGLVHSRREAKAAQRLLRKRLKKPRRAPRVRITDQRTSSGAAKRDLTLGSDPRPQ